VRARAAVAVIPFGGGTSVVGGVEPLRDPFAAAVSVTWRD
jgi:alkyldihydroxyacetonephosphate synthase